jgi:hypothetical protein
VTIRPSCKQIAMLRSNVLGQDFIARAHSHFICVRPRHSQRVNMHTPGLPHSARHSRLWVGCHMAPSVSNAVLPWLYEGEYMVRK